MTDRLLTDCDSCEFHATWEICGGCPSNVPRSFDSKTLKAVGEWLEEYHEYPHNAFGEPVVSMRRANCPECLWQLKQGKVLE